MSDITSCVYIGKLAVIEPSEFNRLAGEFSTWFANINSSYNKVFVGTTCVYEAVRILSTISIIARRPAMTADLLESDFNSIYDYLDELANIQVIELCSVVKPYSRKLIYEKLHEAEGKTERLTKRQIKDLAFFVNDYNKEVIPNKKFIITQYERTYP